MNLSRGGRLTYERTLEKSFDGDMTKLSSELDHDMRCDMLGSSSILFIVSSVIKVV